MPPRKEEALLRPIDTCELFQTDCIRGLAPAQIHHGVPLWVGAIFVDHLRTDRIVLVHEGLMAQRWADRFAVGAVNSRHWGCQVTDLGRGTESLLRFGIERLGVPGALISSHQIRRRVNVMFRLYSAGGLRLNQHNGLDVVRWRIETDRIPRPVDQKWQGRVEAAPDLVRAFNQRGHPADSPVAARRPEGGPR
jgi:hypothetical protein